MPNIGGAIFSTFFFSPKRANAKDLSELALQRMCISCGKDVHWLLTALFPTFAPYGTSGKFIHQ
jgi:hypothetical protein